MNSKYMNDQWTLEDDLGIAGTGDILARMVLEVQPPFSVRVTGKSGVFAIIHCLNLDLHDFEITLISDVTISIRLGKNSFLNSDKKGLAWFILPSGVMMTI